MLRFDEDILTEEFPVAIVDDVSYSDKPAQIDALFVNWALTTGKRRHTLALINAGIRAAYFVKRADWQYESERRLILPPTENKSYRKPPAAKVHPRVLRYIIMGSSVDKTLQTLCRTRAAQMKVPLLRLGVGKKSFDPFFVGKGDTVLKWHRESFEECEEVCRKCYEPAKTSSAGECSWCSVSDEAKRNAPMTSMLHATLGLGVEKAIPLSFGVDPKGYLVKQQTKIRES